MAANWTDFVSGAVLTAAQLNGVLDNFEDIAIFNEQQASGTNGGTFTSGSYIKRTLNTTVVNNITTCSIASSVITLPAGTYAVTAFAPAYTVARNKLRLQNMTDSTTIALGQNCFADLSQQIAVLQTLFTITGTKTIELQHRAQTTINTNGYGVPCSFGDNEVYAQIQIVRVQ
jgi:hypothetical protein